jgi:hypothetical protein
MEKTGSRVAMGLMCALAICCAVMYITADGADVQETILAPAKSVYGIGGPTSVSSEDVEKVGTVFTNTPDGRMRLTDYLTNVEKEISAEEAARKRDVEAVRAQMARNFAFNKKARAKMKKALLHKMAVNAKKAHDDLEKGMRFVQAKFASMAKLQNERFKEGQARSKKLRALVQKNKEEAASNLKKQVLTQQRAMATLAAKTNARIAKTNKHVAANAAQIKANAKKAAEELSKAVNKYDKKANQAAAEAKAGRSKLKAQLLAQDKSIRAWASNKMKVVMAATAAKFRRVREEMAKDRQHADLMLKAASSRMSASLNAFKALNNKRFAKTVKDIAAAKAEAKARVAAAKVSFKVHLNALSATVKDQVSKTNHRIDQLNNVVTKNKVAQAQVNANVAAESKRMVKLGNKRYQEHLKKDKELAAMIKSNKAATDKRLKVMSAHYMMELDEVRATMKKNRAHATHELAKNSAKLYAAIEKSERAQMATNKALADQTRRARLDIEDSLREAKDDFAQRLGALHKTVVHNDKKFEKKMDKLTGIVRADAVKNAKGRAHLKTLMESNKKELTMAVRDAVKKGEARMSRAETKLVGMNKKTKAALNMKITTEISSLAKRANSQIEGLRLNSAKARSEMRKELLFAVRSMADEAKKNLDDATKWAKSEFIKAFDKEAAAASKSAAGRAAIAKSIETESAAAKDQLNAAVATMQRSLLALKTETEKKIKKTNKRVDAYAAALTKEASDVDKLMKAQMKTLTGKIAAQSAKASADIAAADAKSAAGYKAAMSLLQSELSKAEAKSSQRFGKVYTEMGKQRSELDEMLGSSVADLNDSIAKQAALADSRFEKTVKDIKAARKEAAEQVKGARQDFATGLYALTSNVKAMETRLNGEVQVVSGEVISFKAAQLRVNRHTAEELARIEKLMNDRSTESKKARGKLRAILDENKRAAAEEVAALSGLFQKKIVKVRKEAAEVAIAAKKDLTAATEKMYTKLAKNQEEMLYENKLASVNIKKFEATAEADIVAAKKDFSQRLTTLTNVVAANHKKVERGLEVLTGVVRDYKAAGEKDRGLIKEQNKAMASDMQKAIDRAIQIGEAKAKAVEQRARENLAQAKQSMLVEITETVEEYADMTFKTIQGGHQKIADNYLSLKAYAVTAKDKLVAYTAKGKGKNLSSLGDLLGSIAALSDVVAKKSEGLAPPGAVLKSVFSGEAVKVTNSVSKINGLVNEFVEQANDCRMRWPMGLGKYLLLKLEASMGDKGVLQVDKVEGHSGNWVFVNGKAVGLSNKLNDFEGLAVRMAHYESTLAKLTAKLSGKVKKPTVAKPVYASPPEWQGD